MSSSSAANNKSNEKMKLAPLRSLNDFLLDSKKYIAPPFNDMKRFNNRVTSNLLYYQTNYFIVSAVVFSLFSLFRFGRILGGAFGIAATVATALFAMNKIPQAADIRSKYPFAIYVAGAADFMLVYAVFRPILYLALAVLVPVLVWIVHASLRSRGLKNKASNKMDQLGGQVYTNTPMGFLLSSLGFEARDHDE